MKKTIFLFIILTFVIVNFGCTNKCKVEFDDLDSETDETSEAEYVYSAVFNITYNNTYQVIINVT